MHRRYLFSFPLRSHNIALPFPSTALAVAMHGPVHHTRCHSFQRTRSAPQTVFIPFVYLPSDDQTTFIPLTYLPSLDNAMSVPFMYLPSTDKINVAIMSFGTVSIAAILFAIAHHFNVRLPARKSKYYHLLGGFLVDLRENAAPLFPGRLRAGRGTGKRRQGPKNQRAVGFINRVNQYV